MSAWTPSDARKYPSSQPPGSDCPGTGRISVQGPISEDAGTEAGLVPCRTSSSGTSNRETGCPESAHFAVTL